MHEISTDNNSIFCGRLGGGIFLAEGQAVPQCNQCGKNMSLYFQLDVKEEFKLPFITGSKLNVFCCPQHDEIPEDQYSDLDKVVLPNYGKENHGHYSLMLIKPDEISSESCGHEKVIMEKALYAKQAEEIVEQDEYVGEFSNNYGFKVGGVPSWINYSVNVNCTCGGKLRYLCQTPDGYDFYYGKGPTDYHTLLLGNQIVFMACEKQCSPYSIIAVCDN